MQCPDCGAYAGKEDLFCGECGRPLARETPPKKPLSPEEAKDLPTVLVRPSSRPSRPAAAAVRERKSTSLAPGLVLVGIGLLLLCLFAGGLLFWLRSRETTTVVPTQSQPDQRVLVYGDDFADPDSGWDVYDDEDTQAGYVDGEYGIAVHRVEYMAWGNPDPGPELVDFEVEVDARLVEGPLDNNFGLLVRYQSDEDNFYWFQISADGYYSVDLRQGGEWITLVYWEESDAVQQGVGATNRLRVVCQGSQFSFFANDTFLTEVTDGELGSGSIGLAAGAYDEAGVVIHFDDLRVYALEE